MCQIRIIATAMVALVAATALASAPQLINFQGILKTPSNTPVPDASYLVTFTIYNAPAGGTNLWSETQSVTTTGGLFAVLLGASNPVPDSAFKDSYRWLGITVSPDPEMAVRQRLVSVGYAYRVNSVDSASGGTITSKVSIGPGHTNTGVNAFVAGQSNTATGNYATIGGGSNNIAGGIGPTVGGGLSNTANGQSVTIGGGQVNSASGLAATVGGGEGNTAGYSHTTVSGGLSNSITGFPRTGSTIGGGENNSISNEFGTIAGGLNNRVSGFHGTVGGGQEDTSSNDYSTVGGGLQNAATGPYATVSGGTQNRATGQFATVAGGNANRAALGSTIGGGNGNTASGGMQGSTIAGGINNVATADGAFIGGGVQDTATGTDCVIGGGAFNIASGILSTIGGGGFNKARGQFSVVAGGGGNFYTDSNLALGDWSAVPGGRRNTAGGVYSFAAGRRAKANHAGTFVWADSNDADFASGADAEFNVRASGGTRIYSNSALTAGVTLAAGASAWVAVSDSTLKRNIRVVDGKEILAKVMQLPIKQWSYKAQDPGIEHIGPMAQDFYPLFKVGDNQKTISTIDPPAIALAAVQELYRMVQEQKAAQDELRAQNEALRGEVQELKMLVQILATKDKSQTETYTLTNGQLGGR